MKASFFLSLLFPSIVRSLTLKPGVGLRSRDGSMHVVLFEHTEKFGTGGLVLNQPTPLRLKDLRIPRFGNAFPYHSLMLGGGLTNDMETNVAMAEMAPWFWLHCVPDLPKSTPLPGAKEPLFLGGNIDIASEWVLPGKVSASVFKFFYKYKQWSPGQLESEIVEGRYWDDIGPIQPNEALRMYNFPGIM